MMSSSLALISCNAAFREGREGRGDGAKGGGMSSKESMGRCTEKEGEGGGVREWDTQHEDMGGERTEDGEELNVIRQAQGCSNATKTHRKTHAHTCTHMHTPTHIAPTPCTHTHTLTGFAESSNVTTSTFLLSSDIPKLLKDSEI